MTAFVPPRSSLRTVLALAFRDLRGGVSGFRIFLACLAIGVAAIAGVGSLARGLSDGLSREGRNILGGDVSISLIHREATPEERALLEARGRVSTVATLRAMARAPSGSATLVDLKAVDAAHPLVGTVALDPPGPLAEALAERDGVFGAAVDPALLARLDLTVGDRITVGTVPLQIRAAIAREPDALAGGIGFGPRVLVSQGALGASGLVQPGSLVRWTYRLALPDNARSDAEVAAALATLKGTLADSGFEFRSRADAAPQLEDSVDRFTQFLTIIGLTALIVGGVGVANAVTAYVDRKREVIATLKCLGAPGPRVFAIYGVEILALALAGTAIGLLVGAALPFAVVAGFGAVLPLPVEPAVYGRELFLALAYGLLTAIAFALWPLGRIQDIPVASLYRERVEPSAGRPQLPYVIATAAAAITLAGLSILAAYDTRIALVFAGCAVATFLGLRVVAFLLMAGARRLTRPRGIALRMAITSLHRPGALTPSVVLSLGLGLALLVTLTLIDAAVRNQITAALPAKAPSFFFIDVPSTEAPRFDAVLHEAAPAATLERVPMLRGTFVRIKGVPVGEVAIDPDMKWALNGDRGVTYAAELPPNSRLVAGTWWAPDHTGTNLVSFEEKLAKALKLGVGDEVTLNVLGRTVTATVANIREVRWQTLGINFFMVFSPNTFAGAPHMDLATVTYPGGAGNAEELGLLRRVTDAFPMITAVRVRDALDEIDRVVRNLAVGVRAASSITLLASLLVLAGALAAGQRQRLYDAVVLKTLGATRGRLLAAYALEYGLVGAVTAVFGLLAGSAAAYAITREVMRIDFAFDLAAPLAAVAALAFTIVVGLLGTYRILGEKPARHLKSLS